MPRTGAFEPARAIGMGHLLRVGDSLRVTDSLLGEGYRSRHSETSASAFARPSRHLPCVQHERDRDHRVGYEHPEVLPDLRVAGDRLARER